MKCFGGTKTLAKTSYFWGVLDYDIGNALKKSFYFQTSTDSLDDVEDFCPVDINLDSLKHVLTKYEKHRKISMTKLQTK